MNFFLSIQQQRFEIFNNLHVIVKLTPFNRRLIIDGPCLVATFTAGFSDSVGVLGGLILYQKNNWS